MQRNNQNARWRWYHGVLLFGGIQAALFGLGYLVKFVRGQSRPDFGEALLGSEQNDDYYNQFEQPIFAPPDWVFAPIWAVNNTLATWGIIRVLNMPEGAPGRARYLSLMGAFLLEFVSFNAAYFGLSSPINGALLTVSSTVVVIEAMRIAVLEMKDWRVVLSLSTLLPWLILASLTSSAVALWNADSFYQTDAPLKPPRQLIKSARKK